MNTFDSIREFIIPPDICDETDQHEHPAHSGDHWELHRPSGAGRLIRLIEIISKYGLETIDGLSVQIIPKIDFKFKISQE